MTPDNDPAAEKGSTQRILANEAATQLRRRVVWRQDLNQWWMCSQTTRPGYWSAEDREGVSMALQDIVFEVKPEATKSTVDAVKGLLKPLVAEQSSVFDKHPQLLPVANGVVDLQTFELSPAAPGLFLTRSAPTAYVPRAKAPRWESHLSMLFDGDDELVACFQRLVGSALVGDATIKPQVFVFLLGPSGSGKGLAMRALTAALGEGQLVSSFASEDFTARGSGRHRQWLTRMNGARIAVIEEARSGALDVAQLKRLSGGDAVIANEMRQADRAWTPSHTLFFTSNVEPDFDNDPEGMKRRYVPLQTGPYREPVPAYEEAVLRESEGILAWAVEGCRLWRADGGGEVSLPERTVELRDGHISDHDTFGAFIEDQLERDPAVQCTRKEIQLAYRNYLRSRGDFSIISEKDTMWTKLYSKIGQVPGVRTKTIAKQRGWVGICVNDWGEES